MASRACRHADPDDSLRAAVVVEHDGAGPHARNQSIGARGQTAAYGRRNLRPAPVALRQVRSIQVSLM
jgi:hypothetical protein